MLISMLKLHRGSFKVLIGLLKCYEGLTMGLKYFTSKMMVVLRCYMLYLYGNYCGTVHVSSDSADDVIFSVATLPRRL